MLKNFNFAPESSYVVFLSTKAATILLATLVTCSFAVPNFLSSEAAKSLPTWAQHRLVLGADLQGGTFGQFKVDRNDVRAQILKSLHRDVRNAMHEARIDLIRPVALRGDAVEVRPLEASFQAALSKLDELSKPLSGARPADVVDAGGRLIRVIPTDDALEEREQQIIDWLMPIVRNRMNIIGIEGTVAQTGAGRIAIQAPGIAELQRQLLFSELWFE